MSLRREWREACLTPKRNRLLEELRHRQKAGATGPPQRIAFFTATTWRPIQPFLEGELLLEGIACEFHAVEYESMAGEIAGGSGTFDTIVLALDDDSSFTPSPDTDRAERLAIHVDALRARTGQLIVLPPPPVEFGPHGRPNSSPLPGGPDYADGSATTGVECLPWAEVFPLGHPIDAFDRRRYALGRIRYSEAGFARLASRLAMRILRRLGIGLKAVIVDLDHTLWGGVIGDVGPDGIALGDGYPGRGFRELQTELKAWRSAGLLLAVASKNDAENALSAIDQHPEMQLRSADFSHLEIHWEPKSVSVGRILKAFNIAPDAVLFIDDNPREREEVTRHYPTLRVLDFPDDPLDLADAARSIPWPLLVGGSQEDGRRAELQDQQAARQSAIEATIDREDYLSSLGITLEFRIDETRDLARAAQLHQKTNQFNLNPVRLTESQVQALAEAPDSHVFTVGYRDRFGDAGTVCAATIHVRSDTPVVETFVLSCRVLGLGVETAILAAIGEKHGAFELCYRATEKNHVARTALSPTLDFPEESGRLAVTSLAAPAWITLHTPTEASHA